MDDSFYTGTLYPFQDEVLQVVDQSETEFYLSGGTAASRGYLQHRFSDDLGLFVTVSKISVSRCYCSRIWSLPQMIEEK